MSRPKPVVSVAQSYVGGRWLESESSLELRSPIDGSVSTIVALASTDDVAAAAEAADDAWRGWRSTPAHERARLLANLAGLVEANAEDLTTQIVVESGKVVRESRAEVDQSIQILSACSEESKRIAGEGVPMDALAAGTGRLGLTIRVPVGLVAGITPFNVPVSSPCHKLGPALAAGNTFVLKPHPHGSGVATLLAQLVDEAGFPPGVFNVVQGGPDVGRALVRHSAVRLITLTGSGRAAEEIVAEAGLKQTLFELGGIAPTIVHKDADLNLAARQTAVAAFALSGQSCVSTQRILVHESVEQELSERLVEAAEKLRPGDPFDEASGIGPLVNEEAAIRVASWVEESVAAGAQLLCGGRRSGAYLAPTLIAEPKNGTRVLSEEIFGPVASITAYRELEEAIGVANAAPWGLKAGIFTSSLAVALLAVRELQYGAVNVNAPSRFRVIHEPYGGVKQSGWGREGPHYAIRAMTTEKMVSFAPVDWPDA